MSKKLTGNGLWESSRMMLPEHKEQLLAYRHDMKRKSKPLLDEQRVEELSQLVSEAVRNNREVIITVFNQYKDTVIIGRIQKIDLLLKRVKVLNTNDYTWIELRDLLNIEITNH